VERYSADIGSPGGAAIEYRYRHCVLRVAPESPYHYRVTVMVNGEPTVYEERPSPLLAILAGMKLVNTFSHNAVAPPTSAPVP